MKFLLDECLPEALVVQLRVKGHDVIWARETYTGWDDRKLLATATRDGRIVVSADRDFGTLTLRQGEQAFGVVIVHFDKSLEP